MDVTGQTWQSKLHTALVPVEERDQRGGSTGGGPELADIERASGLSHEPAAEQQCKRRTGVCALLDWQNVPASVAPRSYWSGEKEV
jgi:hypothetical protein